MIVAIVLESDEMIIRENVEVFKFNDVEMSCFLMIDKVPYSFTDITNTVCFADNGVELSRTKKN